MKRTLEEIREALIKVSWNINERAKNQGVDPLLVCYPNEVMLELFGDEVVSDKWIDDNKKK